MAKKIRILIADESPNVREMMKKVIGYESRAQVVGECEDGEAAINLANKLKPDMVIIDMNIKGIDGVTVTEKLTSTIPNILVIVTYDRGAKKNLRSAMVAGAREYIVKPFSSDDLIDTIINLYDADEKRRAVLEGKIKPHKIEVDPKIITVFSTKGGVGKSTIATNIAVSLSQKTKEKVVLVDLDLQFGDVSVMLNLYPQRTITDLVKDMQSIDDDILEDFLIQHKTGVKVLPAPIKPEHSEYITSASIERILKGLLKKYKYIVIDTAPAFDDINLTALDMSDEVLFVTTLDLHTVKNSKAGLQIMNRLQYDENKVKLTINRYHKYFGVSSKDLEKSTGKEVKYIVPEEKAKLVHSINDGNPIVLSQKNNKVSKSITSISNSILGIEDKKSKLVSRLFSR